MSEGIETVRDYLRQNPMYARRVAAFLEMNIDSSYGVERCGDVYNVDRSLDELAAEGLLPPTGSLAEMVLALRLEGAISYRLWFHYGHAAKKAEGLSSDEAMEWVKSWADVYEEINKGMIDEAKRAFEPKDETPGKVHRLDFQ